MPRRALVVAINRYDDSLFTDLRGTHKDANEMYAFLTRGLPDGWRFETEVLTDPTATTVMQTLNAMTKDLTDDSVFVFYFSGHGACLNGSPNQSLLCRDASDLLFDGAEGAGEITPKYLAALSRRRRGNKFFCYDVCRTQLLAGKKGSMLGAEGGQGLRDATSSAPGDGGFGRSWTLSACADGQTATDDGSFARALVAEMEEMLRTRSELKLGEELVDRVASRISRAGQRPASDGEPFVLAPGQGKTFGVGADDAQAEAEKWRRKYEELVEERRRKERAKPAPPANPRPAGARKVLTIARVEVPFRWAPPGRFMMGSPEDEEERWNNEKQHEVILTHGFWLAETQTTQKLWKAVMGSNPSRFTGDDLRPVENVSWEDSQKFIRKLNGLKVSGAGTFRLPTESEWEYACRAGATTAFPWGNVLNGDKANCNGRYPYGTEEKGKYLDKTTRVGSYESNAWGLYDMIGNVWEWCQDWYYDYPSGTVTDPQGASSGSSRVLRGGSWIDNPGDCRSAGRFYYVPAPGNGYNGFRLAMTGESALS